jgi:hypothetical protein
MKGHLIADPGAAGCLKEARRKHGLRGEILSLNDEVEVGPLREDAARDLWWQPIRDLYLDNLSADMTSYGEQWSRIGGKLQSLSITELVIWTSDAARDQTHLRVSLSKLAEFRGDLFLVEVPPNKGLSGVSRYYPKELAAFEALSSPLDRASRDTLAQDYRDRLAGSDGVRYQTDSDLEVRSYDCFDEIIIDACPEEWTQTHKVIGQALANCDPRNWVRDMFLRWRLKTLCDQGALSARGTLWFVDHCDVMVRR